MKIITYLAGLMLLGSVSGCGEEFLDMKYDKTAAIPSSIEDFQAMLDDATRTMNNSSHVLGSIGADEFYITENTWNSAYFYIYEKNAYIWAKEDVYEKQPVADWDQAYRRILYANLVLEGIDKITPSAKEQEPWNNVKGSALFFRAFSFYQLAQLFCRPYNDQTARDDPGIPLRLESDITLKPKRASVEATYSRIIEDLGVAADLLPVSPVVKFRPSRPAVYALLSRLYMQMEDYAQALHYADLCLQINNGLIDFNDVDLEAETSMMFGYMKDANPETIFNSTISEVSIANFGTYSADTTLLASYMENDLRKQAYFREYAGTLYFRGAYSWSGRWFTGLATDEVLLTRAECYARDGNLQKALTDLNRLLLHRFEEGTFVPVTAASADEALGLILAERRKELIFRGVRWEDLRRLNKDERFAKTLVRVVDGEKHVLPPGDPRYVWPIPDKVIELSGLEQNPR